MSWRDNVEWKDYDKELRSDQSTVVAEAQMMADCTAEVRATVDDGHVVYTSCVVVSGRRLWHKNATSLDDAKDDALSSWALVLYADELEGRRVCCENTV